MQKLRRWWVPLVSCTALPLVLVWVRWGQFHPTPTDVDLAMRAILAQTMRAEVRSNHSRKAYLLSREQQSEIIANCWVDEGTVFDDLDGEDDIVFSLGDGKIVLRNGWRPDAYFGIKSNGELERYYLRPVTSIYLRRWLRQPDVEAHIGINEEALLY